MASEEFKQLLSKAPEASDSDTMTVVGALARSPQPGKFVLGTAGGQTIALDVAAVKNHKVVAESVGQLLVELELDATKLSPETRAALSATSPFVGAAAHQAPAETMAALRSAELLRIYTGIKDHPPKVQKDHVWKDVLPEHFLY
jgi:hypothetical protein